jgi:hypothetical protein
MKRTMVALALLAVTSQAHAILSCVAVSDEGVATSANWLVGQPMISLDVDGDLACAANGAELAYITQRLTGLHLRNNTSRTVLWRDADAEFILDNLQ